MNNKEKAFIKERRLNGISLFSGIGGFEIGLRDYIRTMLYCEADKHAQAVLLSRMAEGKIDCAPICTDVREITGEIIDLPIDIIFGGFPCQDISVAGKGVGLEGERSGLFFEIVRLAKKIKPTFLFLENVPAIRTRGLDRVIQELTEIGYDCRWCMLSAAEVGAKHKRERWFMLAYRRDTTSTYSEHIGRDGAEKSRSGGEAICCCKKRENCSSKFKGMDSQRDVANSDKQGLEGRYGSSMCERASERVIREDGASMASPESERYSLGLQSKSACSIRDDPRGAENSSGPTQSDMGGVVNGLSAIVVKSQSEYLSSDYWQEEPEIPRVTEEKEQRVERIKRLGNAVVPLQVRVAFEYLMGIKAWN